MVEHPSTDDERGESREPPVVVPPDELDPATLRAVVESFVLREGTDYGAREFSLEEKVAHVLARLGRHEARIVFDPDTETVSIVDARACAAAPDSI